jgi:PadR family transcriptional regulator PadR
MYGVEITNLIKKASEGTYQLKKPTLYSALKRLETDKLVVNRTEESPIGGERHYYTLTPNGREFLANKKYDWVYSKLLIDNLVLDKDIVQRNLKNEFLGNNVETMPADVIAPTAFAPTFGDGAVVGDKAVSFDTAGAAAVREFIDTNPNGGNQIAASAAAEITPRDNISARDTNGNATDTNANVAVAIREITRLEEYSARSSGVVITVPLKNAVESAETAQSNVVELNAYSPARENPEIATKNRYRQMGVDFDKIQSARYQNVATPAPQDIYQSTTNLDKIVSPFVKHSNDKKSGRFVMYNRLRVISAFLCAAVLSLALVGAHQFLKTSYTSQESIFFNVAWVAVGVYVLTNLVLFSAFPKSKRAKSSGNALLLKRGIISACLVLGATSINVICGLSPVNASDFFVFTVVPAIIGSLFVLEAALIIALRRVPFFLA